MLFIIGWFFCQEIMTPRKNRLTNKPIVIHKINWKDYDQFGTKHTVTSSVNQISNRDCKFKKSIKDAFKTGILSNYVKK